MNRNYLFLIIILVLSVILISSNANYSNVNSPDEIVLREFTVHYSDNGELFIPSDELSSNHAILRGTMMINDKNVPLKFVGFIVYMGGLIILVPAIFPILTTIFGLLIILFLYKSVLLVSNSSKLALLSSGILVFIAPFLYWANQPFFENIAASFFFLSGFYYFIKFHKNSQSTSNILISGMLFATGIFFRYDLIIPIILFCLPWISLKKEFLKKYLLFILIIGFFSLPLLISADTLYGSPLNYPEKILNEQKTEIVTRDPTNVYSYFSELFIVAPLLLIAFIPLINIKKYGGSIKKILLGMLGFLIFFSWLIISKYPLKHPNILHESYTRYFLIFFILLPFLIVLMIKKLNKKIMTIFILVLVITSVMTTFDYLHERDETMEYTEKIIEEIILNTPEDSLLIVSYIDKSLFPRRETMSFLNFLNEDIMNWELLFEEIDSILNEKEIFIYQGKNEDYVSFFLEEGYNVTSVGKSFQIFKITNTK
jgi:hypothetical protein